MNEERRKQQILHILAVGIRRVMKGKSWTMTSSGNPAENRAAAFDLVPGRRIVFANRAGKKVYGDQG